MVKSQFIDDSFELENCHNFILSIQCALDGFSFSIFDTNARKFIVLNTYELNTATAFELRNEIENLIKGSQVLNNQFKQVHVAFIQKEVLVTPSLLFDSKEQQQLFNFSFDYKSDEIPLTNLLPNSDIAILSTIPELVRNLFLDKFPNCTFINQAIPVIRFLMRHQRTHQQVFVVKQSHQLMVGCIKKDQLEFLNNFYVKNDEDCLYYIFNVAKHLNLAQNTEFTLMGGIESKSLLTKSLKQYFKNVVFPSYSTQYAVSYTFLKEPDHYHLPLLELALCE